VEEVSARLGKTCSQIALAWLLAMPGVTSAIIGARNLAQLRENLGAGDWDFPSEEWKKLDDASALSVEYPGDFQAFVETLVHNDLSKQ
jgi:aryl-alcohol dehydrogenase-like predicted oxidoreductase